MYRHNPNAYDKPVTLVCTNLPPGKLLFYGAGQSETRKGLLDYALSCGHCPEGIEIVPADEVGLEWHDEGKKLDWSEEYRKGRFVVIYPDPDAKA